MRTRPNNSTAEVERHLYLDVTWAVQQYGARNVAEALRRIKRDIEWLAGQEQ